MPFYDYVCTECGNTQEEFHGIKEVATLCMKCKQESLQRCYETEASPVKNKQREVGSIVKSHIKNARREIEEEKRRAREI